MVSQSWISPPRYASGTLRWAVFGGQGPLSFVYHSRQFLLFLTFGKILLKLAKSETYQTSQCA